MVPRGRAASASSYACPMPPPMREDELLARIRDRSAGLEKAPGGLVVVGPGDDCAVVRTPGGAQLLLTVDQLVIGRHINAGAPIDLIARKAVARSVSDIAAMGGTPTWAMATGLLPHEYAHADELFDRMSHWARHWGCPLVGGDIATGEGPLSLTVTIAGEMGEGAAPVLRSGARAGDMLWITGRVGGSLESGWHALFEPRLEHGQRAARAGAHAMIDISDGLGKDASRVGAASGVVLEIDAARLPISEHCKDWREAAGAGEDYELLICAPAGQGGGAPFGGVEPALLGPIGRVRASGDGEAPGAVILDDRGGVHDASGFGWEHR